MATPSGKAQCTTCGKEKSAVRCEGCQQIFCYDHLTQHRQQLSEQLGEIEISRDLFRQTLNEQIQHPQQHALIKNIDQWESESIRKIQQTANECRQMILEHTNEHFHQIEVKLSKLTNQLKQTRQENDYNETDLNQLKQKLIQITTELDQLSHILIEEESSSFIRKISMVISSKQTISSQINSSSTWKQNGSTVAGGNGQGNQFNQLCHPEHIYVDDYHRCIYIADFENDRIVEWKYGAQIGQVVAGGNGKGDRRNQLNKPTSVILDKKNDSLIICDYGNSRVVRWPRRNGRQGEIIISNIHCLAVTMDVRGDLYISDYQNHEVRRWKIGETNGTIVAGGNESGSKLNQLDYPTFIFLDKDDSLYVSDRDNHRVMKWMKGAKEGIIVAGGNGEGNSLRQFKRPQGVNVDNLGNVYVTDSNNHRIMCWPKGSSKGSIIVGGNGPGQQANQLSYPTGLSFDQHGNLYIGNYHNHRIQKFDIIEH